MYQYNSYYYARAQPKWQKKAPSSKWQKKALSSNINCVNTNSNMKPSKEIYDEAPKIVVGMQSIHPYSVQYCHGNESPESVISPSPNPIFEEESKSDSEQEMKSSEAEIKDPENLTYDEITALLGPNNEKEDFLTQLFKEEKNRENSFCKQNNKDSKFLYLRLEVLSSLITAVKKCKLDPSTGDRALYYFDRVCLMKSIDTKCIHFVAFICLWISCKFNETANTMPHIYKLIHSYPKNKLFKSFEIEDFTNSEQKILSILKFKLKCVLPIDFIEFYLHCDDNNYCCLYPNDKVYDPITKEANNVPSIDHTIKNIMAYVKFFTDIANEDYELCNKYKPSILAISIICCARKALKITPYLNKNYMLDLFRINDNGITHEMDKCFNRLWNDYTNNFPKQAKEVANLQNKSLINM